MPDNETEQGRFNLEEIAKEFPDTSETMLLDRYLKDKEEASTRLFRIYRHVPAHYHTQCDEVLYVLSGEATFWMADPETKAPFKPGDLIIFPKNTVHAIPEIIKEPVVFLAIDTPRRAPDDVTFVDPEEGSPETFISNKW